MSCSELTENVSGEPRGEWQILGFISKLSLFKKIKLAFHFCISSIFKI